MSAKQPCTGKFKCSTCAPPVDVRRWLEESNRPVGAIVHTIENGNPLRAERTAEGWVFRNEGWQHGA